MSPYMAKKFETQAVKAWEDLIAEILTQEEARQIEVRFENGKVQRYGPKHIIDKLGFVD